MNNLIKRISKFIKLRNFEKAIDRIFTLINHDNTPWPMLLSKKDLKSYKRVLILAPHPDDETFGFGGSILLMLKLGIKIKIIWMTYRSNQVRFNEGMTLLKKLKIEEDNSNAFPLSHYAILQKDVIKIIQLQIDSFHPDAICLPSFFDTHHDHSLVVNACATVLAEKNWQGDVIQYEVWNTLIPNYIIDISSVINKKKELIRIFKSQISDQKIDYFSRIIALNRYRGLTQTIEFAEGIILTNANTFIQMVKKKNI